MDDNVQVGVWVPLLERYTYKPTCIRIHLYAETQPEEETSDMNEAIGVGVRVWPPLERYTYRSSCV